MATTRSAAPGPLARRQRTKVMLTKSNGMEISTAISKNPADEIMAVSDRIAVMYEGRIVGTVDADKVSREELGLMMAGARREEEKGEVTVD